MISPPTANLTHPSPNRIKAQTDDPNSHALISATPISPCRRHGPAARPHVDWPSQPSLNHISDHNSQPLSSPVPPEFKLPSSPTSTNPNPAPPPRTPAGKPAKALTSSRAKQKSKASSPAPHSSSSRSMRATTSSRRGRPSSISATPLGAGRRSRWSAPSPMGALSGSISSPRSRRRG